MSSKAPQSAALLWSGGKDSALALHHARQAHPDIHIAKLVTCISQAYDRVSMHGVRRQLIEDQARAIGLPVEFIVIPRHDDPTCPMAHTVPGTDFPPNDVYSRTMIAGLEQLKTAGVRVIVFGDIFLEDLRAYREKLLAHVGLEGRYPLWGRDTDSLFDEFIRLGFQAVTVCVDTKRLTGNQCGRLLNSAFRVDLPVDCDPCGERGEYHSFAFDGPIFRQPVPYRLGEIHMHEPFAFQELLPSSVQELEPASASL
ncbi:MAG TPA: ATP-binding protein [Gemmata sp.]|jgi:uncharacterized protein (TIGR00290 family)|nr:ATP-binding protein [Gemmata sp.]